jgi:hypothetical protein
VAPASNRTGVRVEFLFASAKSEAPSNQEAHDEAGNEKDELSPVCGIPCGRDCREHVGQCSGTRAKIRRHARGSGEVDAATAAAAAESE